MTHSCQTCGQSLFQWDDLPGALRSAAESERTPNGIKTLLLEAAARLEDLTKCAACGKPGKTKLYQRISGYGGSAYFHDHCWHNSAAGQNEARWP